jgi:hypothetical protein
LVSNFHGCKGDSAITLIDVTPDNANHWDTVHGKLISLLKIATSVIKGKKTDDNVEGSIKIKTKIQHSYSSLPVSL